MSFPLFIILHVLLEQLIYYVTDLTAFIALRFMFNVCNISDSSLINHFSLITPVTHLLTSLLSSFTKRGLFLLHQHAMVLAGVRPKCLQIPHSCSILRLLRPLRHQSQQGQCWSLACKQGETGHQCHRKTSKGHLS